MVLLVWLLVPFLVRSFYLVGYPKHSSVTITYHDIGLVQAFPVQWSHAETCNLELGLS